MVEQTAETALVLDRATRARICVALRNHGGRAWAPKGIDPYWWSEFAKGRISTVPLSRWRTVCSWFPQVRIAL